jgi:hypothetical protein
MDMVHLVKRLKSSLASFEIKHPILSMPLKGFLFTTLLFTFSGVPAIIAIIIIAPFADFMSPLLGALVFCFFYLTFLFVALELTIKIDKVS